MGFKGGALPRAKASIKARSRALAVDSDREKSNCDRAAKCAVRFSIKYNNVLARLAGKPANASVRENNSSEDMILKVISNK